LSVALLASPVIAQTLMEPQVPVSTDNVFWGLAYSLVPAVGVAQPAYGSVALVRRHHRHARTMAYGYQPAPAFGAVVAPAGDLPVGATNPPRILDCVHVTFPQCGNGGGGG
jgi:hypothetical protein